MTSIAAAPAPAPAAETRHKVAGRGQDPQAIASAIADAEERIERLREQIPKLEKALGEARKPEDRVKLQADLDKARKQLRVEEAKRDELRAQLAAAGGSDADVAREEMKRRPVDAAGDAKRAKEAQETAAAAREGFKGRVKLPRMLDVRA